jgi:hypothetical protein
VAFSRWRNVAQPQAAFDPRLPAKLGAQCPQDALVLAETESARSRGDPWWRAAETVLRREARWTTSDRATTDASSTLCCGLGIEVGETLVGRLGC